MGARGPSARWGRSGSGTVAGTAPRLATRASHAARPVRNRPGERPAGAAFGREIADRPARVRLCHRARMRRLGIALACAFGLLAAPAGAVSGNVAALQVALRAT